MAGTYRRLTDAVQVTVASTAGSTLVPNGFIPANADAFQVVNPNDCFVRLKGFKSTDVGEIVDGQGWLFPPFHIGVYATQKPYRMSTLAVARPGKPIQSLTLAPLEVNYGFVK